MFVRAKCVVFSDHGHGIQIHWMQAQEGRICKQVNSQLLSTKWQRITVDTIINLAGG